MSPKSNPLVDELTGVDEADRGDVSAQSTDSPTTAANIKPYEAGNPLAYKTPGGPSSDLDALEESESAGDPSLRSLGLECLCPAVMAGTLWAHDLTTVDTSLAGKNVSLAQYRAWDTSEIRKKLARSLRLAHHVHVDMSLRATMVAEARILIAILVARARRAGIGRDRDVTIRGGPGTESEMCETERAWLESRWPVWALRFAHTDEIRARHEGSGD